MVESLKRLEFGADRCRMIVSLELGLAMLHLENFLSPEQYMGTSNQGGISQQKRGISSAYYMLCLRYSRPLNPTALWLLGYGEALPLPFRGRNVVLRETFKIYIKTVHEKISQMIG